MIRWGFIGIGDVVEKKSGKAFWIDNESEVVAVMCRNINSAKEFAQKNNIEYYYDDAEKLINNPNVDAVYIATPPSTHMSYAKAVINANKPVYVEKPMGISSEECEEVVKLAEEKGVGLYVAYYRRALPYFQKVKELLENKVIGEIRCVDIMHCRKMQKNNELVWRRVPEISGGGLFHDMGCHTLDLLDYIISPIGEVYGLHDNQRQLFESDDTVTTSFRFENGVLATGIWCMDVSEKHERVKIIGNDGRLEFQVYGNIIEIFKDDQVTSIEIKHPDFVQEPLIKNIIANLNGKEPAISTGKTAIRTTRVIDIITK